MENPIPREDSKNKEHGYTRENRGNRQNREKAHRKEGKEARDGGEDRRNREREKDHGKQNMLDDVIFSRYRFF